MIRSENPTTAARERILQRVVTARAVSVRPLYWRVTGDALRGEPEADLQPDGSITLARGTTVHFDTYFGAFFESHWRTHTAVGRVTLRIDIAGAARVRLWRRTTLGTQLLDERTTGGSPIDLHVDAEETHHRLHGTLFFSVSAMREAAIFRRAVWVSEVPDAPEVGLAAVFCTFNRETDIARVLHDLGADREALARLARIFVVNQGKRGLPARLDLGAHAAAALAPKLRIIEQSNFGGAGGFTRGLIAALDDPEATHAVLIDDDIRIEPESLARMAAFFSVARHARPLGGHMLDLLQPTRLFEAGAVIAERNWSFQPNHHMRDLLAPEALADLSIEPPTHYNGWWCFGLPLSLLRTAGLPLPCFIRGDDMEFGLRLHAQGIYTIPLPGVAVWHEPFYLKFNNWQLYYETRNMLVTASLHLDASGPGVAWRMLKHLLLHLLTFRYYSAELILRAVADFLAGPAILDGDPARVHESLAGIRRRFPLRTVPRVAVLPWQEIEHPPRHRSAYKLRMIRALVRHALVPVGHPKPRRLDHQWFRWVCLVHADHVAVDTGWEQEMSVFLRSRRQFWDQGLRGATTLVHLAWRWSDARRRWRASAPRLTSLPFWRAYLGVSPDPAGAPRDERPRARADAVTEPA